MDNTIQKTVHVLAQLAPSSGGSGASKSFQQLVRSIGEAKTKHEEDRIMKREAVILKEKLGSRDTNTRQMREYLIRLIYCEMLGVECSWGYIHAVKFTQSSNIADKRIGYLASSLLLHPNHELNMLLINSLQRDLRSSNMLEVSMALIIICRLIGEEMVPPLLPLVREKMHHPKELVRKKAILAMHHFYRCSSDSIGHLLEEFRQALSDPDPGVMDAAVVLLHDMIKGNPSAYKDLCPAFKSILSQIISRRLPQTFEYHSVPAPWIQIRILRILAILGTDDAKISEDVYDVIEATLGSAECTSNIGQAITYECIRTISSIYPKPSLIQKAANTISRFLVSSSNNWKYLGITALAALVLIEPKYALNHQMTVIECLDDPDETLKRKTLDLLYKMTNPSNVTVITEKLIAYLRKTTDEFIKTDLVSKITQLAERFAPDNSWFISTMNSVFELGGSLVRREVAHNLMRLIAEGTEDEDLDKELRGNAVSSYIALLSKPQELPDVLIKIICWVVGEYVYEVEDEYQVEDVLEKITGLLQLEFKDIRTYSWIINSIARLIALIGYVPEYLHSQLAVYLAWEDTDVQQRCSELFEFSEKLELMQAVLPLDSACEDLEIDASLSFLDSYVSEALVQGASPYKPPHMRVSQKASQSPKPQQRPSIKFEPYATPSRPIATSHVTSSSPSLARKELTDSLSSSSSVGGAEVTRDRESISDESKPHTQSTLKSGIQSKGNQKWSRTGYAKAAAPVIVDNISNRIDDVSESVRSSTSSIDDIKEPKAETAANATSIKGSSIEAVPQIPVEQAKKQQLASALFTGLSGPAQRPSKQRRGREERERGSSKLNTNANDDKGKTQETSQLIDLEGIDFSTTGTAPVAAPPSPPPPEEGRGGGGGGGSLFDQLQVLSNETHVHEDEASDTLLMKPSQGGGKPLTESSTSFNDDLIGLFDGSSSTSTSLTSGQPSLPPVSSLPSSFDTTTSLLPTPSPSSSPAPTLLAIMDAPLSSNTVKLPDALNNVTSVSGWNKKELVSDGHIRLSVTKLLHPDKLALVLTLSNQKQAPITSVNMSCTPPSNTKGLRWKDGEEEESEEDLSWTGDLEGFANGTLILSLVPKGPSIAMNLKGEILYTDNTKTQRRLFYDIALYPTDFMRPYVQTTPQFAEKWGSYSNEKKLSLKLDSIKTPDDLMKLVSSRFNFHEIQIIGLCGVFH
ncbi:PREDICTED: AP-4 complex subunit epsilon-like [Amphimedon queenslandica]|uniref:AP-4 complex subunit epsilon n=1 Tax=Amphimedon queenslandica TaxID=400682 RepID=A0AAN0I946_AMPQE|nr:PREDICTED: AP-4 complex subunit epsilon-like [Amphimedon queenslandica]|eukprot:XP_003382933.2 PREDICTED: AP-4 complex subunit epsilon-like [Amphimedon queenslandica]